MNNNPVSILVVEDNPGDVVLIKKILTSNGDFHIESVDRLSAGIERIQRPDVDLILLDLSLPDSQGLGTFHKMHLAAQGIPVVVLSGTDDEELAIEAMNAGAQDYLIKGQMDPSMILRSVHYAVQRGKLERERLQLLRQEQAARAEAEAAQQRFAFLAKVSTELVASLNYQETLETVSRLAVKEFADYCVVYMLDEAGTLQPSQILHRDPARQQVLVDLIRRYPPDMQHPDSLLGRIQRSRQTVFMPDLPDELLQRLARDAGHLEQMRALLPVSAILVPLVARDRMLGTITFALSRSERRFEQADLALAEEIARRAALAIDNARLYGQAQTLNQELEKRVAERTGQLRKMIDKLRSEIQERKRVEKTLSETQALFSNLFESAPDAIVLVDKQGQIVRVNAQAEVLFGYSRDELMGSSVDRLLPQHLQKGHAALREAYLKEMSTRPMGVGLELYARAKDSREIPVDIMLSPVDTAGGTYVITAVRDITERKRLQEELAEIHRRLIENIEAERLRLSQELHDVPVQELYGVLFKMNALRQRLDEEDVKAAREIEGRVQEVISSLRRMGGELRPPALMSFGLEKVIRSHVQALKESQPDLKVKMDLMKDEQQLPERVRLALFRVYQNAVSNVIRHSAADRLSIRFWFDAEQVVLEVADNGEGFSLPSKWVQLARRGHFGLVGIAERMEAIGGRLDIETAPGKGTRLQVRVPLPQEEGAELMAKGISSALIH